MSNNNHRILLHITMLSGNDKKATRMVDSTYLRINNVLSGSGQLPNIAKICDYCDSNKSDLGPYIRNRCLDIRKEDTVFEPRVNKTNSILNVVEHSERKKIRIVLYPGERTDIDDLNMDETTHNMIVQFDEVDSWFRVTEPHTNPPSFYQICGSEKIALLYLEALMVDACICHYLGVSDVAYHHDDKQRISSEKVLFLREISKNNRLKMFSSPAQKLIKYVASQMNDSTPYISFLSIFTIAPLDVFKEDSYNGLDTNNEYDFYDILSYFDDYCALWSEFQKWYFDRYGRLFFKGQKVENPLNKVFNRNKYKGQISPSEIARKLEEIKKKEIRKISNPLFGLELRYAVIVLKHMPDKSTKIEQIEPLFVGQLHQSKWDIIYWGDIGKYYHILQNLEIVPFIII